jgi:hypothetical protein
MRRRDLGRTKALPTRSVGSERPGSRLFCARHKRQRVCSFELWWMLWSGNTAVRQHNRVREEEEEQQQQQREPPPPPRPHPRAEHERTHLFSFHRRPSGRNAAEVRLGGKSRVTTPERSIFRSWRLPPLKLWPSCPRVSSLSRSPTLRVPFHARWMVMRHPASYRLLLPSAVELLPTAPSILSAASWACCAASRSLSPHPSPSSSSS